MRIRDEILEQKTEAYIGEVWYTIARNQMTYYEHGKRIRSENLAGRIARKVAQGEGGLGLRTDMAYTVKHIQRGLTLMADEIDRCEAEGKEILKDALEVFKRRESESGARVEAGLL